MNHESEPPRDPIRDRPAAPVAADVPPARRRCAMPLRYQAAVVRAEIQRLRRAGRPKTDPAEVNEMPAG